MSASKIIILYKQKCLLLKARAANSIYVLLDSKNTGLCKPEVCVHGSSSKAIDFFSGLRFLYQRFQPFSHLFGLLCCFLCRGARIDSAKQERRTD
ncbi:hypothetical protein NC651_003747 [Populus alba x Populus x berolinensis]|nr:hypothetical protein NC651_003747 [Populus alba x Populus x berolinensis]